MTGFTEIVGSRRSVLLALTLVAACGIGSSVLAQSPARARVVDSGPSIRSGAGPTDQGLDALVVQVLLDRSGFSPGAIDGTPGKNTQAALAAFQQSRNLPQTGAIDEATMLALGPELDALTDYTITPEDVKGPFVDAIPTDMMEKAKLPGLYYTSVIEGLSERFHSTPALLRQLNPKARFAEGERVKVPLVAETVLRGGAPAPVVGTSGRARARSAAPTTAATRVIVSKESSALTVENADGATIFYAPITVGSEHDPLPIGEWAVTGVFRNPSFNYNPDLFWDADPTHSKAKIPPGPNNPVGLVWIDLTKEHYGIHGTPEPTRIGYTESHGCVRLTNWDALKLASLVQKGTPVVFR